MPCSGGRMITFERDHGSISGRISDDGNWQSESRLAGARKTNSPSAHCENTRQLVGPTYLGAVTHPGAKAETHDTWTCKRSRSRPWGCAYDAPARGVTGFGGVLRVLQPTLVRCKNGRRGRIGRPTVFLQSTRPARSRLPWLHAVTG